MAHFELVGLYNRETPSSHGVRNHSTLAHHWPASTNAGLSSIMCWPSASRCSIMPITEVTSSKARTRVDNDLFNDPVEGEALFQIPRGMRTGDREIRLTYLGENMSYNSSWKSLQ